MQETIIPNPKSALDIAALEEISFLKCMGCGSSRSPAIKDDNACDGNSHFPWLFQVVFQSVLSDD
jgi:hypothetical protein